MNNAKHISIIGAGAAGLFAAVQFTRAGWQVDLYDHKHQPGIKLLLAGQSGLNITNNEKLSDFCQKYRYREQFFQDILVDFPPQALLEWLSSFGIESFTGSSGKIFPCSRTSEKLLAAILKFLQAESGFVFYPQTRFAGFTEDRRAKILDISTGKESVLPDHKLILCLGGGSYPETGSDAQWESLFCKAGIKVQPFRAMNCGFDYKWPKDFLNDDFPVPCKNIALQFAGKSVRGDVMITQYGIEGGPVYFLSGQIRDALEETGEAVVQVDLFPDLTYDTLRQKNKKDQRKMSMVTYLKKSLGVSEIQLELIRTLTIKDIYLNLAKDFSVLKRLPLSLLRPRPLAEAISSSGGVDFAELDEALRLKKIPYVYCAGEMLDWEAPTGGYLLQGCFSTAFRVCKSIIEK